MKLCNGRKEKQYRMRVLLSPRRFRSTSHLRRLARHDSIIWSSMVWGMVSFLVGSHFHKVGSQNKIKTKCDVILIYSYHA